MSKPPCALPLQPPPQGLTSIASKGVDRLIHEPARLMVALLAAVKEADFLYLRQSTGLTKGNLSVHLSKLEAAGYIAIGKTFRRKYPLTICRLTDQGRDVLDNYRTIIKDAL